MSTVLVELCCGTAAVSLWALGRVRPLTGFMGSKRRDAAVLCTLLGAREPDKVVLVDGGPWGDVWATLRDARHRAAVVRRLRALDHYGTLPDVWPSLLYPPRDDDPVDRVAQYICLQARTAGCIPVWWSAEAGQWQSPSGSRTEAAHQRGGIALAGRMCTDGGRPCARKVGRLYRSHPARGLVRIGTLADRVGALGRIDWGRVEVHHADVGDLQPVPGSRVYFDPPYQGAPRYAALLPRERVLAIAEAHAAVADLIIVSESEPLPLDGWTHRRLRPAGKPEWLTMSRLPHAAVPEQMSLSLNAPAIGGVS